MANEYIVIKDETNESGHIALAKSVFDTIVSLTVAEEGKVTIADGKSFAKPVICKIANNALSITVEVKIKYGENVNEVCEKLQEKVYQTIYQMTELKCQLVDIKVIGFVF